MPLGYSPGWLTKSKGRRSIGVNRIDMHGNLLKSYKDIPRYSIVQADQSVEKSKYPRA